jgi:hypothetical protein
MSKTNQADKRANIIKAHERWLARKEGRPRQVWVLQPNGKFVPTKVAA